METPRQLGFTDDGMINTDAAMIGLQSDLDTMWLCLGAILVFFMQTGFAMLEVGNVNRKNTSNALIKNLLDALIGSLMWWITGFGIAMGSARKTYGFMGTDSFGLYYDHFGENGDHGYKYGMWLFQWAFAATTATITSGAVAERCTFTAYMVYSVMLTGLIYPTVVCWGWNTEGWASAWKSANADANPLLFGCGVIDFAGSGVVHMSGGVAAFCGSYFLGARKARQPHPGKPFVELPSDYAPEYGPIFCTLGTLILWMGWYGFNGVSTLYIVNYGLVAAKTMVTTTIGAGSGGVGCLFVGSLMDGKGKDGEYTLKLGNVQNGLLGGLVAVTASCSVIEPYAAFVIGFLSCFVYLSAVKALDAMRIDDVVLAIPVHLCCGCFGVVMAGLFATKENYANAYYSDRADDCAGIFYGGSGASLAAGIVFILSIIAWVGAWSCLVFGGLSKMNLLRVAEHVEEEGMDKSEHGVTTGYQPAGEGNSGIELAVAANNGSSL